MRFKVPIWVLESQAVANSIPHLGSFCPFDHYPFPQIHQRQNFWFSVSLSLSFGWFLMVLIEHIKCKVDFILPWYSMLDLAMQIGI